LFSSLIYFISDSSIFHKFFYDKETGYGCAFVRALNKSTKRKDHTRFPIPGVVPNFLCHTGTTQIAHVPVDIIPKLHALSIVVPVQFRKLKISHDNSLFS
jgi:hypothetical protein